MKKIDRRSALTIGLAAASAAVVRPAASQTTDYTDTSPYPGVVQRAYAAQNPSVIPGFKTVSMRDVIMQPGSKTGTMPMPNDMICHMLEGELRHDKDGKPFVTKKNVAWTCNKGSFEQSFNDTNAVVIMRITDLKA